MLQLMSMHACLHGDNLYGMSLLNAASRCITEGSVEGDDRVTTIGVAPLGEQHRKHTHASAFSSAWCLFSSVSRGHSQETSG